jgi:maleate isomerase
VTRTRLALMIPRRNAALEPETYAVLPPDASAHFWRLSGTVEDRSKLESMAGEAAALAASAMAIGPAAIGFGCTAGSMLGGPVYDRQILVALQKVAGAVPCSTTAGAVLNALAELDIRSLVVVTPYEDWVNQDVRRFLEQAGLEVCALRGMGLSSGISNVAPDQIRDLVRAAWQERPTAGGVFISCTALLTLGVLRDLEEELDCPVISSNSALLWALLRAASLPSPGPQFGSLLEGRF